MNAEGVYNFQNISAHFGDLAIRPGFIFRSAQPYDTTATRIEQMKTLGITTIFDLGTDAEVEKTANLNPLREIEGLTHVFAPVFESSDKKIAGKLMAYFSNDTQAMTTIYAHMLAKGSNCFRRIFCHLRDNTQAPCIIHCALGKERTGIAIALILSITGVPGKQIRQARLK